MGGNLSNVRNFWKASMTRRNWGHECEVGHRRSTETLEDGVVIAQGPDDGGFGRESGAAV